MNGEEILNEVRFLIDNAQFARYNEINRAYRKIAHMSPASWLKEESESLISFTEDDSEYTINISGIRRINNLWVYGTESGDQKWNYVEEVDQKLFEIRRNEHINLDGDDRAGLPEVFRILSLQPDQIRIRLVPTPDADMSGKLDYVKSVSKINRETVPEMPPDYHDVIAQLAAGYVLRSKKNDKGSVNLGNTYVSEALKEANQLMMDSASNKTLSIDKPKRPWISSRRKRWHR